MDQYSTNPNVDESEDTLSLSDLPMYSSDAYQEEYSSKQDRSLYSSSSSDDDYFEFFSEDWSSNSACSHPSQNIIFCGKLISHREPVTDHTQKLENKREQNPRKRSLSWMNFVSFIIRPRSSEPKSTKGRRKKKNQSRSQDVSSSTALLFPVADKQRYEPGKGGDQIGFPVGKVSILTYPAKPRWYLFLDGIRRFPVADMEMRGIRSRQSRRGPSTLYSSDRGYGNKVAVSGGMGGGRGLWGLVRALSCGGHRPPASEFEKHYDM